ncbi:MAG TPA: guanitoxin biosynthesis L-enduracididine beta-hydroxylase GntD [Thermoanaerobaculia bacterium]|nr:guanitoxin biosynthesis L-enduracididine beta-hydroxylase GntD [Thermoanaerobaculia bacterium]
MKTRLNDQEKSEIMDLLGDLTARYQSAEDPEFVSRAQVFAHRLPLRVREILNDFRLYEPASAVLRIAGYPIDDQEIGPTPFHWKERQKHCLPRKEEILLVLLGSLLGDVIAWATQQDGAVVHDIAPVKGHEHEQLGSGSAEELTWHTEDAFHPFRGDYLGMMCLRNPDRVPTTFASLDISNLDEGVAALLFEPHYTIRPDESHLRKNRVDTVPGKGREDAHDRIDEMNTRPEKIPVLFGSPDSPYCRLDPYFMDPPDLPAARQALDQLIRVIDSRLEDLVLEPGEFCFIDNFKAVHGRRPFKARFDGTDRWLKRVNITRNLRLSRAARPAPESRLLV